MNSLRNRLFSRSFYDLTGFAQSQERPLQIKRNCLRKWPGREPSYNKFDKFSNNKLIYNSNASIFEKFSNSLPKLAPTSPGMNLPYIILISPGNGSDKYSDGTNVKLLHTLCVCGQVSKHYLLHFRKTISFTSKLNRFLKKIKA